MAIFHKYVELPEGNGFNEKQNHCLVTQYDNVNRVNHVLDDLFLHNMGMMNAGGFATLAICRWFASGECFASGEGKWLRTMLLILFMFGRYSPVNQESTFILISQDIPTFELINSHVYSYNHVTSV